jgi:hypothetical protein
MTPSKQAKAAGLKSLRQVSQMQGYKQDGRPVVSEQTLTNWHRNKPLLFKTVIAGCVALIGADG